MEINKIYNEPCLETLSKMDDNSIDCVITSPPYWQLRDYGYEGQWGLEPTFNEYLEHLWSLMDELHRVLKPKGSVWINLGDTYNNNSSGVVAWIVSDATIKGSEIGTSFKQALYFKEIGFNLHDTMIYAKDAIAFPYTIVS